MRDNSYSKNMDEHGFVLFQQFNNCVLWFSELNYTPLFDHIDARAKDIHGNEFAIEIKVRDIGSNQYDSIFINELKYNELLKEANSGKIAVFFAIYNDGCVRAFQINNDFPHTIQTRTVYDKGLKKSVCKSVCSFLNKDAVYYNKIFV